MTKKRIFKYACLCLSFVCAMFLCVNVVFGAIKQQATCSVTVGYEPGIKAIVEVIINDNGVNQTQVIFNNTDGGTQPQSSSDTPYYFSVNTAGDTPKLHPSNGIVFKVTNKTSNTTSTPATSAPITALVRLDSAPQNVSLSYENNSAVIGNSLTISTSLDKDDEEVSEKFYIQTLFSETVPFVVELGLVQPQQQGGGN